MLSSIVCNRFQQRHPQPQLGQADLLGTATAEGLLLAGVGEMLAAVGVASGVGEPAEGVSEGEGAASIEAVSAEVGAEVGVATGADVGDAAAAPQWATSLPMRTSCEPQQCPLLAGMLCVMHA